MTGTDPAADRIDAFLADHGRGRLFVVTGYASIAGLRWLHERSDGREVVLVIGDLSKRHFEHSCDRDAEGALAFMRRRDVKVLSRRLRNRSEDAGKPVPIVHAKAWMVEPKGRRKSPAVLVGSANLTLQGLYRNVEMMARADSADSARLWREMQDLAKRATDAEQSIRSHMGKPARSPATASKPKKPSSARGRRRRRSG